jgi:hypothetical protein
LPKGNHALWQRARTSLKTCPYGWGWIL